MLISNCVTQSTMPISFLLHCAPVHIPCEYKAKITALAKEFVKYFSPLSYRKLEYSIVYNRACYRVDKLLKSESRFTLATFSQYLNYGNLFYSQNDVDTLVSLYRINPNDCFDYLQCFFAVKLKNTKKKYLSYIKELDPDDIDSTLQLALISTLNDYTAEKGNFSFEYLDRQLRSFLFDYIADSGLWGMNRNLLPQYRHMCALFDKYNLSSKEIPRFLYEVRLTEQEAALEEILFFDIDPADKRYSFKDITVKKAVNFYHLYIMDHSGVTPECIYDPESDSVVDLSTGIPDPRYDDTTLLMYINSTFLSDAQKYIVHHMIDTASTCFTAQDLALGNVTRYEINKVIAKLRNDYQVGIG